jgi:hypothetical protein
MAASNEPLPLPVNQAKSARRAELSSWFRLERRCSFYRPPILDKSYFEPGYREMNCNYQRAYPMSSVLAYLPRWTKRVSIEEGGRDPLGLSRVSGMITDFLLQGIITQTYRARYYSFYCWAIWHIEQTEPCTEYDEFTAAFQRRD